MTIEMDTVSPGGDEPIAAAIFLHGLGGHAVNTWTLTSADRDFWPRWLADDFPRLRVYSIGYDSGFVGHSQYIHERATGVLNSLLLRPALQDLPFVFVCHSMGGLLAKQIVIFAQSAAAANPSQHELLRNMRGSAFLATPHRGARLAELVNDILPDSLTSKSMQDLKTGTAAIESLHKLYKSWAEQNQDVKHLALYETKRMAGQKIVDHVSADPSLPNVIPIAQDFNHSEICKFTSTQDERYLTIVNFLKECLPLGDNVGVCRPGADPNNDIDSPEGVRSVIETIRKLIGANLLRWSIVACLIIAALALFSQL